MPWFPPELWMRPFTASRAPYNLVRSGLPVIGTGQTWTTRKAFHDHCHSPRLEGWYGVEVSRDDAALAVTGWSVRGSRWARGLEWKRRYPLGDLPQDAADEITALVGPDQPLYADLTALELVGHSAVEVIIDVFTARV